MTIIWRKSDGGFNEISRFNALENAYFSLPSAASAGYTLMTPENMRQQGKAVKHSIIVPAYNEEKGLPIVIEQLQSVVDDSYEIIIVDDGSSDKTLKIAKMLGCRLIGHNVNQGKGAAMRTGIRHAKGQNVLFIDADGTYPVSAIPKIVAALSEYDMAVGRRNLQLQNNNPINRFGNWLFGWLMRSMYTSRITDPLSGLYGIRKSQLERMELQASGFEIETELTIKAANLGFKTTQIDIEYHERAGETKLRPFFDGARILRTIFALLFLYRPTLVFAIPGISIFMISTLLMLFLLTGSVDFLGINLGYHSLIFFSMFSLSGFQIAVFGITAKIYAVMNRYSAPDRLIGLFMKPRVATMVFCAGLFLVSLGSILAIAITFEWIQTGFSAINELSRVVLVSWSLVLGFQAVFSSFYLAIFSNEERRRRESFRQETVYA